MRRIATGAVIAGVGVVFARALGPRLHKRMMAGCERMFEQVPDDFPPKRMMRGIEEIRANTARTARALELLGERSKVSEEQLGETFSTEGVGHAA